MVQRGDGKMAALRLDAGPFDGESIRVQAEARQQADVFLEAMVMVAGVERGLGEQRGFYVLQNPEIAVDVIAFHLMGGGRRAPEESGRELEIVMKHWRRGEHLSLKHGGRRISDFGFRIS